MQKIKLFWAFKNKNSVWITEGSDNGDSDSRGSTVLGCIIIAFQYNRISELETSEVLTVCQQLVLTAIRYPNLSETTNVFKFNNTRHISKISSNSCDR